MKITEKQLLYRIERAEDSLLKEQLLTDKKLRRISNKREKELENRINKYKIQLEELRGNK